jgi:signal transduction histidine kinase
LQEMDRRKSEFVAITSHELRTPIAIMLGYASLLHDEEQDEMKKGQLSIIEKQASFLSGMVDMLINLHELSDNTAQIALRCMPVELPTLLKSALDFTKNHSTSKRKVDVTIDSGDFSIKGDEVRLMLALSNLIDNAIKFSNDGDTVEITVAESPFSGVVITIEDHGIGIPGEELENIFEPFYQVESSLTRRYGGMGLGLAIVRGIVELHGGKLDIRSQVEIGTRVIVSLPDAPPEDRCMDF